MRIPAIALLALLSLTVPARAELRETFAPGSSVLFSDDFSQEPLGHAPERWSIHAGAFGIAARGEDQWLSLNGSQGEARMKLDRALPGDWTLEFDLLHERSGEIGVTVAGLDASGQEVWSLAIGEFDGTTVRLDSFDYQSSTVLPNGGALRGRQHIGLSAEGGSLVAFLGEQRVASMPAIPEAAATASIEFRVTNDDSHALLTNVRLAAIEETEGATSENRASR